MICQDDKKLSLLTVDRVLNHPWRDLEVERVVTRHAGAWQRRLNALSHLVLPTDIRALWRTDRSDHSNASRDEQENAKQSP